MDSSEQSLLSEIYSLRVLMRNALDENIKRGSVFTEAEAAYYSAKAQAAWRLKQEGLPSTFISLVIKGEPEVNEAMSRYHQAEVEYKNSQEAINVFKHNFTWLKEQYAREWNETR